MAHDVVATFAATFQLDKLEKPEEESRVVTVQPRTRKSNGSQQRGGGILLNKQLFSSLKIRRCMISWMKCWARKSPAYIKNLGNIRVRNLPVPPGRKSANYLYGGLTCCLTGLASRAFIVLQCQ